MKIRMLTIPLIVVVFTILTSCNSISKDSYKGQKGLYSLESAKKWQHSLISGNGTMGILVAGDPANEQVIFNHEFLAEISTMLMCGWC